MHTSIRVRFLSRSLLTCALVRLMEQCTSFNCYAFEQCIIAELGDHFSHSLWCIQYFVLVTLKARGVPVCVCVCSFVRSLAQSF